MSGSVYRTSFLPKEGVSVKLEDLMANVAPEWRSAFVTFIETGEAEEAFLNHLDRDKATQDAVELAFGAQSEALEGLAHALRESDTVFKAAIVTQSAAAQTFDAITRALESAMRLPKEERHAVLEGAIATVSRDIASIGERRELQETLSDLKHAVGVAEAVVER